MVKLKSTYAIMSFFTSLYSDREQKNVIGVFMGSFFKLIIDITGNFKTCSRTRLPKVSHFRNLGGHKAAKRGGQ